ncbi:MAG: efflux RND transporter periplasmic adaptor subunit, partial [Candidatus Omnitrophica bacterium]|nr:efflux RND transporter periplasmic adaptor subunit [Candidatus Omnitrophota bacterium]
SIRSAWATVTLEESQLILAESPARPEEIKAQEAAVEQAEANSANILAQLSKTVLRSPISGVVTQKEIEIGEIASPNSIVVSVISADKFEIEADISEADIAKVQLDNTAEITLDAFTEDQKWTGKVIRINPAEKIISGVVYYETAITFNKLDPKIASGMTANVDILTASKENVLSVPQRAVIQKNGNKIIRVLVNGEVKEQEVQIGLRGSDGEIEVISGLKEGDEVITFIEKSD